MISAIFFVSLIGKVHVTIIRVKQIYLKKRNFQGIYVKKYVTYLRKQILIQLVQF